MSESFGRDTQLPSATAFWNSTGSKIWQIVMPDYAWNTLEEADFEGELHMEIMAQFVSRMIHDPPQSQHRRGQVYALTSLTEALSTACRLLQARFPRVVEFDEEQKKAWLTELKGGFSRTMMEGSKESELFKRTFPIPPKHSVNTNLFPEHYPHTRDGQSLAGTAKSVDLEFIACKLFAQERFTDLAKLLITYYAIGRGGEVKFLSYKRMYFDMHFNCVFTQWFQRKTLISSPSGFTAHFGRPEVCAFMAFGCFWVCNRGLPRDYTIVPGHASARRSMFGHSQYFVTA